METEWNHPRTLIPELCRVFYQWGWITGTGGGISIKGEDGLIYVTPSGVQKERIKGEDLFAIDATDGFTVKQGPTGTNKQLKVSECTPLFMIAYKLRSAGACIHTHSMNAALVSQMFDEEFTITQVEMIKGITNAVSGKSHSFYDKLRVPIISNTASEKDLSASMADAMVRYPETHCIIVRSHGIYVWGMTWERAKGMVECYDYLFEFSVKMAQLGISRVLQKAPG